MIVKILHQMWNQRWHNSWIFAEMILIAIFLWIIIDPLYTICATAAIPDNYEKEGRVCVTIEMEEPIMFASEALRNELYSLKGIIERMPEVEAYANCEIGSLPNDDQNICDRLYDGDNEEKWIDVYRYSYYGDNGSNASAVLGIKDANSGKQLKLPDNFNKRKDIFISRNAAMSLFGTTEVTGRYSGDRKIAGVFEDIQINAYREPFPATIQIIEDSRDYPKIATNINTTLLKLKKEVDTEKFIEKINNMVADMPTHYMRAFKILSMRDFMKERATHKNTMNTVRQKTFFGSFALVCIFLCMLGTFWVRMNNRRGDIGIMKSMGASRNIITRHYITEAVVLISLSFAVCLPVILHIVTVDGFIVPQITTYDEGLAPNPEYAVNNFYIHFAWVTAITYVVMLAITVIGTFIPVYRATRILPADALRDE